MSFPHGYMADKVASPDRVCLTSLNAKQESPWLWALEGREVCHEMESDSLLILKFLPGLIGITLEGDWNDLKMKESEPPGPRLRKPKGSERWTQSPQEFRFASGAKRQHHPQSLTEEMLGAFGGKHSKCAITLVLLGAFWITGYTSYNWINAPKCN